MGDTKGKKNKKEIKTSSATSASLENADDDWPTMKTKGSSRSGAAPATPFAVFATMYSVSFLLELMEKWHNPAAAVFFLIFFGILQFTQVRLSVYILFLLSATAYELIWCFPDVANHVNLAIFINILQVAVAAHTILAARQRRPKNVDNNDDRNGTLQTSQDFFTTLRPVIGVAVFFMYFFAGFHKLNHDFFNPRVSCTNRFLKKIMAFYKIRMFEPSPTLVITMSVATVVWEVGGAFALLFARTQPYMLLYSLMMHLVLAPCSFYDFASMVFACFAVFMPPSYWKVYQDEANVTLAGGVKIARLSLYAVSAIMIGAFTWIYKPQTAMQIGDVQFKAGLAYCASFLLLAWPILRRFVVVGNTLPKWQSFRWTTIRPLWVVIPVYMLLVVFGMSNYLGLRTAGTFSMFSNLKTEGPRSNHLLLGANPIKFWNYQEDIVHIQEAVVYQNTIDNRQTLLKNVAFPLIEFQKKLHEWKQDSPYPIYAYFDFREQCFESLDMAHDERWLVKLDWRHYWMDFRMIQMDDEPNRCVW
jgi:hypothetical protein